MIVWPSLNITMNVSVRVTRNQGIVDMYLITFTLIDGRPITIRIEDIDYFYGLEDGITRVVKKNGKARTVAHPHEDILKALTRK